jgi:hypothetical protein
LQYYVILVTRLHSEHLVSLQKNSSIALLWYTVFSEGAVDEWVFLGLAVMAHLEIFLQTLPQWVWDLVEANELTHTQHLCMVTGSA